MLHSGVGLTPKLGLDYIKAQHRTSRRGSVKRRVIGNPQVAFEPNYAVGLPTHAAAYPWLTWCQNDENERQKDSGLRN